MNTRLSLFCTHVIEGCWLVALLTTPLFFNVHSARIFEPDKTAVLRSVALVMALAWIVIGLEQRSGIRERLRPLLATPILLPALLLLVVTAFATAVSVAPRVSLWGSYARLQGLYTTAAYVGVFLGILALLRSRDQLDRLVTTVLVASLPVALYGIIQYFGTDPLSWASDVTRRVASTMGNPLFVAAFLILTVPLTLYRLFEAGRAAAGDETAGTKRVLVGGSLCSLALQMAAWPSGPAAGTGSAVLTVGTWVAVAVLLGKPLAAFVRIGGYTVLLSAQLMCIWFSQSRGPWLGLIVGLFCFALVWPLARRRWRAARLVMAAGLATVAVLIAINLPASRPSFVRDAPYVGRLGQLLETESGSGRVRVLIWEGVEDLVAADPLRALVGYGPETLNLVFPPHYPPELGRIERRDALPDRAHNETFDTLVTAGVLGLLIHLLLFTSLVYYGLQWTGVARTPLQRRMFLGLWTTGGAGAVLLTGLLTGAGRFSGVALPVGLLGGLFAYLCGYGLRAPKTPTPPSPAPFRLLVVALLAAVVAHFVEIQLGIAVTATRTTFWSYAALLVVCGRLYRRRPGLLRTAPAEDRPAPPSAGRPASNGPLIASSLVTALVLVTLVYDFVTPHVGAVQMPSLVWLFTFTWAAAGIVVVAETAPAGRSVRRWGSAFGLYAAVSLSAPLAYAAVHASVLRLGEDPARMLPAYLATLLLLIAALGGVLLRTERLPSTAQPARTRTRKLIPVYILVYVLLASGALWLAYATNVNPVRADMVFRQASTLLAQEGPSDQAVALYRRALALEPRQDVYHLYLGRALLQQTGQVEDADALLREAERALLRARTLAPLNPDHPANLARFYQAWALRAESDSARAGRLRHALTLFEEAATRSPNTALLWNDWGNAALMAGDTTRALGLYRQALVLDDTFYPTYVLLGNLHGARADWEAATQAYARAVALAPDRPELRLALATAQAQLQRRQPAIPGPNP